MKTLIKYTLPVVRQVHQERGKKLLFAVYLSQGFTTAS
jgi:hypothetical protein